MTDTNEDLGLFNQILQQRYANAVLENVAKDARILIHERRIQELEAKVAELTPTNAATAQA